MIHTTTTAALAELVWLRDCSGMRDRKETEVERLRTRERLEATLAGLSELDYLKQRQELLVRNVLNCRETVGTGQEENRVCSAGEESFLNHEEKLLEDNILLLRKQLVNLSV